MQIAAGAQAIQIFDTWGGLLAPHDFERYIFPYVKQLIGQCPKLAYFLFLF